MLFVKDARDERNGSFRIDFPRQLMQPYLSWILGDWNPAEPTIRPPTRAEENTASLMEAKLSICFRTCLLGPTGTVPTKLVRNAPVAGCHWAGYCDGVAAAYAELLTRKEISYPRC